MRRGTSEAAGALASLADDDPSTLELVITEGGIDEIVRMLSSGGPSTQEEAAAALAALAAGSDPLRSSAAGAGAVMPLIMMLSFGSEMGKEQAALALATLARRESNRAAIVEAQAIPALQQLIASSGPPANGKAAREPSEFSGNVKTAAAKCLAQLIATDELTQALLVEEGGLGPIVSMLREKDEKCSAAAAELLGSFSECFAEALATAKMESSVS